MQGIFGSGKIRLSLSDDGPGVPDEDKEKVFDQFFSDNKDKRLRKKGTGLGLVISRKIAEAHGGQLWVEDSSSGGTLFVFEMPGNQSVDRETWFVPTATCKRFVFSPAVPRIGVVFYDTSQARSLQSPASEYDPMYCLTFGFLR